MLTAVQCLVWGEEEMRIEFKRSHITDMSGTAMFFLAAVLLESKQPYASL